MNKPGIYIYGIINSAARELAGLEQNQDAHVYLITHQDVAAVVSDEEIVDLTHLPKDVLAWRLIDHQRVIETVMGLKHTIIPMKLGTFASDLAQVQEILARGYTTVTRLFQAVGDKLELDVVVTWPDLAPVLKAIGAEPEILAVKQQLLANPRAITVEDQMRVGLMAKKSLDRKREKLDLKIRSALGAISADTKVHERLDDRMITNAAFLIEREHQAEFEMGLEHLNAATGETLHFRCVGPLPPYSFCTLEVRRLQFAEINWARAKLGLPSYATKEKVRKAYQAQAVMAHPDKHPEAPDMTLAFDEVNRAYRTLAEYELALEQAGLQEGCSFCEQDVRRNDLLVKVRE